MSRLTELGIAEATRRRELASDKRAGSYARRVARQRQYAFLRQEWKVLTLLVVLGVPALVGLAELMPNEFARGLFMGGGLVAIVSALWQLTVQMTGTAPTMMGDLGEQWTAQELRKLGRRGWRLVNHVQLRQGDIDHVLVGPGGVFAVETKWSAQEWRWNPPDDRLRAAAVTAGSNARDLRLWHELKSLGVTAVTPVVVLWQGAGRQVPGDAELEGARLVTSRTVDAWVSELGDGVLSEAQVEAAWQVLDQQCRLRDPGEEARVPLHLSPGEWLARVAVSLAAGCAGLLAVFTVPGSFDPPVWGWLGWWLLMLVVGVGVARVPRARFVGLGWLAGVIAAAVTAAMAVVVWVL